ncbi:hypothetical protein IQ238_22235 [Pleurocapsales cyanobacterium LEGE 06147]|nr:hypothetical protein [Pleurocapsales cyanobacterium LEGE 06147]
MTNKQYELAIVGAGLAGLTGAQQLQKKDINNHPRQIPWRRRQSCDEKN